MGDEDVPLSDLLDILNDNVVVIFNVVLFGVRPKFVDSLYRSVKHQKGWLDVSSVLVGSSAQV